MFLRKVKIWWLTDCLHCEVGVLLLELLVHRISEDDPAVHGAWGLFFLRVCLCRVTCLAGRWWCCSVDGKSIKNSWLRRVGSLHLNVRLMSSALIDSSDFDSSANLGHQVLLEELQTKITSKEVSQIGVENDLVLATGKELTAGTQIRNKVVAHIVCEGGCVASEVRVGLR